MIRNILRSKYFTPVIVIVLFWLGLVMIRAHNQKVDVDIRVSDLENRAGEIEKANKYIEKLLTYVKMPEFLEREARIRLNYMLADEKVAFVYEDKNTKIETVGAPMVETKSPNILKKIWNWINGD